MSNRQSNQLPNNLPQLQNLIKRDAESYKDEFLQQYRHFESTVQVFELNPGEYNKSLDEQVMFLAQVTKSYPEDLSSYPQKLIGILSKHSTVLHQDMRMSLCKALILLRHKEVVAPADLLQLFFELFKCQDKSLRAFLRDHIVTDLKNTNAKHKDVKLNSSMQNFMFKMINDSHHVAAKMALKVMIDLYKKNVWNDAKTVNVIASACYRINENTGRLDVTKLTPMALRFFLGADEEDDDKDDDDNDVPTVKDVKMANKVNKKTKKRAKQLDNARKAHKKNVKKVRKVDSFNFSALHLIHDPQKFAEELCKLYMKEGGKQQFEVTMLFADLISRLIGTHQLFVLNYYKKIADYLRPHQKEVIPMLQFAAQAAHELIPHDDIQPVVSAIANNFITERNNSEVIAIGLNAMREICKRCPFALDETLLRDLAEYKTYKDKAVMMAARSLIGLYRSTQPELLHKKDRGRPTEAMVEDNNSAMKQYGEADAKDFIPGAEVIEAEMDQDKLEKENNGQKSKKRKRVDSESDSDESNDGWEDVDHSGDENPDEPQDATSLEERKAKAMEVTSSRILTDADFKRIEAAQLKKQVQGFSKSRNKKRRLEEDKPVANNSKPRDELVDLANIEMIHKKRKHDKEARLATVMAGREDREKFGQRKGKMSEHASTTNKDKAKKKNFMMMKHKLRRKVKKSFVDKQRTLRKTLKSQYK